MADEDTSKTQLVAELADMRQRIAELEASLAKSQGVNASLVMDELMMRTLVDNLPDYIYIKDTKSRFVLNNKTSLRSLGVTTQEELIGKTDFDVLPDEVAGQHYADEQQLLQSGQAIINKEEKIEQDKTGNRRWFSTTKVPLYDAQGEIIGLVGLSRDISELKQAQEAVTISRDTLQRLIQQLPIGVEIFDTQGFTVSINDALVEIFGITDPDQVIGHFNIFDDYMAAETGAQTAARQALAGQTVHLPEVYIDFNQSDARFAQAQGYGYLDITFFPIRNAEGEVYQIVALNVDITERKQFEFDLARFRTILDQAGEAIFVIDAQSANFIDVNKTACQLLGYSQEELLKLSTPDIEISYPIATSEQWAKRVEKLRQFGGPMLSKGFHKRKDGTTYPVDAMLSFQTFEGRDYILAVIRDVTEQAQLEEQLRQAQKMEAVGQLAGGIAHNFNNMLTAIMGYVSLSLDALPPTHPIANDLRGIQETADRAANLTQQLLAFTRKQIIRPKILNINELVLNLHALLRQLISEAIDLTTLPAPDLGQVEVDPGQIEQVLINLVVNARDAMPQGGKLTIETANVTLDQSYADQRTELSPGFYVMLAVSDTGKGMTEEIRSRVFEPFFTTKDVGQGTGLGLATCFGIVKQNHGHISVYSEPDRGTTFKIYLPRTAGVRQSIAAADESAEAPTGTETILMVEDETMVRAIATRILRGQGYTVIEASNGRQALQIIEELPVSAVQLLITDVVMPGMSGNVLANRLKAIFSEIKVLYISGYTDNAIVNHGVLDPGTTFLPKPFTPSMLILKVRELLDGIS